MADPSPAPLTKPLEVIDLGRVSYAQADAAQRDRHAAVVAGQAGEAVLLLECDPVITVSRRATAGGNVLADESQLQRLGIERVITDRGGDVTYHGPGQLMAYPIVSLAARSMNVSQYMRLLEQVMIDTAQAFGVHALRVAGCTGVWVHPENVEIVESADAKPQGVTCNTGLSKLGALGVRVSRGVALHGVALNVSTQLSHYETIVPCGLSNRAVASLAQLRSPAPAMDNVKAQLAGSLQRYLFSGDGSEALT